VTTVEAARAVGAGVDRVDGPAKVTGAAPYPSDVGDPDMTHAALVRATIAAGRIRAIDPAAAEAAPGVLAVITHHNSPRLGRATASQLAPQLPPPLQDDRILHYGQYVAVVVARTAEQATAAARLVEVDYEEAEPLLDLDDPRAEPRVDPWGTDHRRGDVAAGMAGAAVRVGGTFRTPAQTNNPLGLMSTVAFWDGDSLTVHDATQWPDNVRTALAGAFGLPEARIRVLATFVGGGFGAGLRVWQHTILAAVAARQVGLPVKLVLTRPQMFTGVGHRPPTVQRIAIGADRDGELLAIDHESTTTVAMDDRRPSPVTRESTLAYACVNVAARDREVRLNVPPGGYMRAPATAEGNFALETTMDELAHVLGMDPIELRLRNEVGIDQRLGLPWSSKALRACFEAGAERFGWWRRTPEPGSMRDGRWLVGYGVAGVTFHWYQAPCQARASIGEDGTAYVRSAATDIGTGTATVMTQLSAELLGLGLDRVHFGLGDSDLPAAPQAGGSGLTAALGSAVHSACVGLVGAFLDVVADDPASPLRGLGPADVTVGGGRIVCADHPELGEAYTDILARHGLSSLTADGESAPAEPEAAGMAPAGAFGAKFVEVRIDPDLGVLRVARVVSAIDAGRILNGKTAASQIIGGTVGGIGMALFEETVTDPGTGRVANATLADYLVAVNADVPEMDVVFVGEPDRYNPVGVKGVGEIGLVGIAAAIANAAFHATGRRIRSLPIGIDQLL
jgi:xanthine dehydrogenase YagR molybdenum-binding subunit